MGFKLLFTDTKITAWDGAALLKPMLDYLGFEAAPASCGLCQPLRAW